MGVPSVASGAKFDSVSLDEAKRKGCLSCHEGIESIREAGSIMGEQIAGLGAAVGDPGGCVVCHGGTPDAATKEAAHSGVPAELSGPDAFYPDPGSLYVADKTCGQCHSGYVYRLKRALMNTEAGKIQGNLHTWGIEEVMDYSVPWGNYDIKDEDGPVPMVGTNAYKSYMLMMTKKYPKQFPTELKQVPLPSVKEITKSPKLAAFTYQRQECQRCHVTARGREKRGDYRGMGCSSCHILYSNEGYYEGGDPTIDKEQKGHLLTHRLHGTRQAGGGIPVETCNSCHNRGKRIGVTYQGLMEFPYGTPFDEKGQLQSKLHTKRYLFISDDLHHQIESRPENPKGGLLCQDCHTSIDMHGDGNIFGTTLAQVEIECQDCHGTPEKYPWELPLGYSEEFGRELGSARARGLSARRSDEGDLFGTVYAREDGYLLSARGNPLDNVVRRGMKVITHSATGNDFEVPILKRIRLDGSWKSSDAMVAMSSVAAHNDNMECYTCHASWVPQCYGCHVKVDYSANKDGSPKTNIDWVASASEFSADGQTAESRLGVGGIKSPGVVQEGRSYLRWEDPVLGINGEGRVTPLMPGCQVVFTVVGPKGEVIASNTLATAPDEAVAAGQEHIPLAIDQAPVQPHSAQRKARSCESCHNNPKSVGLGIGGGVFQTHYPDAIVEDLIDQRTGRALAKRAQPQIAAIKDLDFDWSTLVKDGVQVATVGTHWPASRAFKQDEIDRILRTGLCMGCHQNQGDPAFWNKVNEPGRALNQKHIEMMSRAIDALRERNEAQSAQGK